VTEARDAPNLRATPQAGALLIAAAAGWAVTVPRALDMGAEPGTMGLGVAAFLVMWALMMAAMMLPAVTPLAGLYLRTFTDRPWRRTLLFAGGYLIAWSVVGVPLFFLARLADDADPSATWPKVTAAVIFATAGGWQLTGAKDRCLRHCRSPLGLLLHYGSSRGRLRDLRVGLHHAAWCVGCCWALMVLFVAFGVMNLLAMIGLAAVVIAEKQWSRGEGLARLVGVVLLVLAIVVLFVPGIAPGLTGGGMGEMGRL
jgi:predicted metal-binding membrane protein